MTDQSIGLSGTISDVLTIDRGANVIEYDGRWYSWGQLADTAHQVAALIDRPGTEVGVVLRNRPGSVGALLGVLLSGGCVVSINAGRGRERTRDDIMSLNLPFVAGSPEDLEGLVADNCRATRIAIADLGQPITVTSGSATQDDPGRPGIAVRMLTSGTTGDPKRIDLSYRTFERVLVGAKHYESAREPVRELRRGVAVVNAPLAHVGGLFRILQCISDGRSFALLDRFTVEGWVDAVRRHRPATVSLVPTALRMVLEADVDPADLSSLESVVSGTAPLDPADADAFSVKFGAPVLVSYGATEFGGAVAGWNIRDHRRFWAAKRGSVGRAHAGCELRIVDPVSGEAPVAGSDGVLEVKASQLAEQGWVRTTDFARIDGDGFLWILGRADQAIIRGGFKIIPDQVRATIERHPSVRGAVVVGRNDRRLGAVPVAAVDLWPDAAPIDAAGLIEFIKPNVAKYELPVELRIFDELPRTESGKVDLVAAAALLREDSSSQREATLAGADGAENIISGL